MKLSLTTKLALAAASTMALTTSISAFAADLMHCKDDTGANIVGVAIEQGESPFKYCEYHFVDLDNNKAKVEYRNDRGELLVIKQVDYSQSESAPDILQIDQRFGELRRSSQSDGRFELEYRKSKSAKEKVETVTVEGEAIVDAGFDKLIQQQWASLVSGKKSTFEFLSPVHGKAITLQVVKPSKTSQCGKMDYYLKTQTCFVIKVNNPLIRMFADSLYLTYNNTHKTLARFVGAVNILDAKAKSMNAVIDYHYF